MQRPDLFAQRVDLGAQLVALGDDGSHAIVGHDGPLQLAFETAVGSARQPREHTFQVGADAPNVEHWGHASWAEGALRRPNRRPVGSPFLAVIEVDELVVAYGTLRAVDGVSFSVETGEVLALLGPNGAGKTSTVETLEGYRRPAGGRVQVLGLDPQRDHAALTRRGGVMVQSGRVYPGLRVGEVRRPFAAVFDEAAEPGALP